MGCSYTLFVPAGAAFYIERAEAFTLCVQNDYAQGPPTSLERVLLQLFMRNFILSFEKRVCVAHFVQRPKAAGWWP